MQHVLNSTASRRSLLFGLATLTMTLPRELSASQREVVDLGHGIEIRDFRLFPSPDVMRFIVELHNANDTPVDTPMIGLVLPHFGHEQNYGWATPIQPVLHPHTSGGVIGVAPAGLLTDSDWATPEWSFCAPPRTVESDKLAPWNMEITHQLAVHDSQTLEIFFWVTNNSENAAIDVTTSGLLWDQDDRLCGVTRVVWIHGLEPGSTSELGLLVSPLDDFKQIANPFTLTDTVDEMSVSFSLQPAPTFRNYECPMVMPWNQ